MFVKHARSKDIQILGCILRWARWTFLPKHLPIMPQRSGDTSTGLRGVRMSKKGKGDQTSVLQSLRTTFLRRDSSIVRVRKLHEQSPRLYLGSFSLSL